MPQAPALRDTSESSNVAKLVTLHHRRHGWAWVSAASLIGLAVYAAIDVDLFRNLTGAAAALSVVPVFALLALLLVGLVDVIVDTSRLNRADATVRASAKSSVSHYPWYAHAHSWPPRHPGSWVACLFLLVAMTSITAYILPAEVNAWAYVLGAEHQDTFNPVSYSQACGGVTTRTMHCNTVTVGYLSDSGADVTWDSQVPLHQPFSARDPLWAWAPDVVSSMTTARRSERLPEACSLTQLHSCCCMSSSYYWSPARRGGASRCPRLLGSRLAEHRRPIIPIAIVTVTAGVAVRTMGHANADDRVAAAAGVVRR